MAILHFKRGELSISHALNSGKLMLANQKPGTSLEVYCTGDSVDMVITLTVQADWTISEGFEAKPAPKPDPAPVFGDGDYATTG